MAKAFTFNIKLDQNQPSAFVTNKVKWKKNIKFTLILDELQENAKKEYKGCYWWNSNGKKGIKWMKNSEKPDFKDPDLAKIAKTLIMEEIAKRLEILSK